jgi:chromosome segregation ATPase
MTLRKSLLLGSLVLGFATFAFAQSDTQSLGDIARANRAHKQQHQPVAEHKVYDNDNLPSDAIINLAGSPDDDSADAKDKDEKDKKDKADAKGDKKKKDLSATEQRLQEQADWAKRIDDQRKEIEKAQHELEVAQRDQASRATAYYSDAGQRLRDDKKWVEEQQKLQSEIADKQKAIDAARQKLEDMQEEARKAGMPSSVRGEQ